MSRNKNLIIHKKINTFLNYIVQQQLFKMNDTSVLYFQSQLHAFIYINKYTIYYYYNYYFFNIQTY